MTEIGAVFLPQLPPERLRGVATAAEQAGLSQLWLWEDCFFESGIASAAAVLAWTERLRVGIGLMPVPLRNVALAAMELGTLHRLFPGRLSAGVGHGVQDWMGQVGARVESPVTLLAEHLAALRALLAGEEVTTEGRYVRLDHVALDWAPHDVPPVLAGATGPRSLRLVGSHADGAILTGGTSPDAVRRAAELLAAGRADARRPGRCPVTVYVVAATGPGARDRVAAQAEQWGWPDLAGRAAIGDVEDVAAAVTDFVEAGADTVVLQPTADDPDPEAFMGFAAEVGRALADASD